MIYLHNLRRFILLYISTNLLIEISCKSIVTVESSPDYPLDSPYSNLPLGFPEPTCATIWSISQTCYLTLDQNDRFNSTTTFTPCTVDLKPECRLIMVDDHQKDIAVIQGGISYIGQIWTRPLAYACCECRGCYGAITPNDTYTCALIYEHEYCSTCLGNVARIYDGESVPVMNSNWNNTVSSIIVKHGCFLQVFSQAYFSGNDWIVTEINENLGESWNDQISSYKCKCGSWPEEPYPPSPQTSMKPVKPTTPIPTVVPTTVKLTTTQKTTAAPTEPTTQPIRQTTTEMTTVTVEETTEPYQETTTVWFIPTTTGKQETSTPGPVSTTETPVEPEITTEKPTTEEPSTLPTTISSTTEPSSSTTSDITSTTLKQTTAEFYYY